MYELSLFVDFCFELTIQGYTYLSGGSIPKLDVRRMRPCVMLVVTEMSVRTWLANTKLRSQRKLVFVKTRATGCYKSDKLSSINLRW